MRSELRAVAVVKRTVYNWPPPWLRYDLVPVSSSETLSSHNYEIACFEPRSPRVDVYTHARALNSPLSLFLADVFFTPIFVRNWRCITTASHAHLRVPSIPCLLTYNFLYTYAEPRIFCALILGACPPQIYIIQRRSCAPAYIKSPSDLARSRRSFLCRAREGHNFAGGESRGQIKFLRAFPTGNYD